MSGFGSERFGSEGWNKKGVKSAGLGESEIRNQKSEIRNPK